MFTTILSPPQGAQGAVAVALESVASAIASASRNTPPSRHDIRDTLASIRVAEDYYRLARQYVDGVTGEDLFVDPLLLQSRGDVVMDWEIWVRELRASINASRESIRVLREEMEVLISGRGDKTYVITSGSLSIQEIAAAELGDWKRWEDIMSYNDLPPNHIFAPGDVVIIPTSGR
jgi:hypothetical protein